MAYTTNATLNAEFAKQEGTYPVEMYVINASLTGADYQYYANMNQDVFGFQLDSSGDMTDTEQLYTALGKINREELSTNNVGEISGVTLTVPNTDRAVEELIQLNNYMRGCDIHVISMFADHLPSGSTASYLGTTDDYNSALKEVYYIDSVSSNQDAVSFICKSKFDIRNVIVPGRKHTTECQWNIHGNYLGSNCDPASAVAVATYPTCDGTLDQCRERNNETRFGGFPSIPRRGISLIG